jgi:metal-dependent amidase/aminoacylase/carboxypeptidase family protein
VNHARETEFAVQVARDVAGTDKVMTEMPPVMGAEDFAFMLEACPGTMIAIGNGDTVGLHDPAYDFNDEAIPYGVSYWARLVETTMPA